MPTYFFTKNITELTPIEIWTPINQSLKKGDIINSILGIPYTITNISTDSISYTGEDRSNGKSESISKASFISGVRGLQELKVFNSSLSKVVFNKAKTYRQRSPMFAILLKTGLIKRINNNDNE